MRIFVVVVSIVIVFTSRAIASPGWFKRVLLRRNKASEEEPMGQAVRIMKYDRAANEAAAIPALQLFGHKLKWFRLDDGVMGGQSETTHTNESSGVHFQGTINTDGGGFCSIRAKLEEGFSHDVTGIRLRFVGDGKTYKFIMSDGNASPFSRSPSWQMDVPTVPDEDKEVFLQFSDFQPSFGGRPSSRPSPEETAENKFDVSIIREIGVMLSLKLSDGSSNPTKTFGTGIFPFSLQVKSIEPIQGSTQ